MENKDLKFLRLSIKYADIFALIFCVVIILLMIIKVANYHHLMGVILGYVVEKFIYERQYRIYSKKEVRTGTNIFINLAIYVLAMLLAVLISFEVFITFAFVIVIYRNIVLLKFKSLTHER